MKRDSCPGRGAALFTLRRRAGTRPFVARLPGPRLSSAPRRKAQRVKDARERAYTGVVMRSDGKITAKLRLRAELLVHRIRRELQDASASVRIIAIPIRRADAAPPAA